MKAVRRGFIKSIPNLCSYLFVGMAYELRCRMLVFLWHLVINGNITRLRLSEATLTACNMSRLDERFELDAVLLHYIEQDEVYWYGDICEEMGL